MLVYHGTSLEIKSPKIIKSEKGRDFGSAFYTTDIKKQAERWALRRAKLDSKLLNCKLSAVVNVYEYKENAKYNIKYFDKADLEWLEMILKCRKNDLAEHEYDIVIGKIANDNVGETVSYVMQGIMRKEDALEKLKFEKINNQIAFCNEFALSALTFVESYTL